MCAFGVAHQGCTVARQNSTFAALFLEGGGGRTANFCTSICSRLSKPNGRNHDNLRADCLIYIDFQAVLVLIGSLTHLNWFRGRITNGNA